MAQKFRPGSFQTPDGRSGPGAALAQSRRAHPGRAPKPVSAPRSKPPLIWHRSCRFQAGFPKIWVISMSAPPAMTTARPRGPAPSRTVAAARRAALRRRDRCRAICGARWLASGARPPGFVGLCCKLSRQDVGLGQGHVPRMSRSGLCWPSELLQNCATFSAMLHLARDRAPLRMAGWRHD